MKKILFLILISLNISAQNLTQNQLDNLADKYAKIHFQTYFDLLSLPCDAHFPADIEKNIVFAENQFQKRDFSTKRLPTKTIPLLLAERKSIVKDAKTVLIYLQWDGQPVVFSQWEQKSPWIPALKKKNADGKWEEIPFESLKNGYDREWRIFARAASDAKGPDVMFLAALDAVKEANISPNFNIKVIMDFEEELGSPQLPAAVETYSSDLKADMFIIFDGPPHITNVPTLSFGARGISTITLTTYGAKLPLHSGNYGNFAPNPALAMVKLLAGMKDDEGKVLLKGFYDGIDISPEYKKFLLQVPDNETDMKKRLGFKESEKVANTFQEAMQYPTLNIRGLKSGEVLENANTIIPNKAIAEIDIRLPLESNPQKLIEIVKNYVKEKGFYLTETDPTDEERMKYAKICRFNAETSYLAFRTPFNTSAGLWLNKAMKNAHGKEPVKIPTTGGSIPISPFVTKLGIDAVAVPTVNPDNNQHSPNENLRIGNFVDGIKTMIAILGEKL